MTTLTLTTKLLIDGQLRDGRGASRPVENPATGETVAEVADADSRDVNEAIAAAVQAGREWRRVPESKRADLLRQLAGLISENAGRLAQIIVTELGKPITEANIELGGAVGFITHAASLLETRTDEIRYTGNPSEEIWTRRIPHGVVTAIVPWNFPSALVTRKLGPALAAGNAIVIKADEKTPLSALALAELIAESELFPAGLVNVLSGPGETVGRQLVRSPDTDLVSMTGGATAGKAILADAAALVKPVHLELGGKAPFIVMADAEIEQAVADAVASRHLNCGQACVANERTFVHRSLYPEFVDRYVAAVKSLVVGDPRDAGTQIGPKVSRGELDKTIAMIDESVGEGAQMLCGGTPLSGEQFRDGYWIAPAVLAGVSDDMRIMKDEVFGPVTPIASFSEWDEVVDRANATRYRLSAYVYTSDLRAAMAASRDLDFGEVYVNRPGPEEVNGFHTGYGESGLGGDDGAHGLDGYFKKQSVYVRY